MLQNSSTDSLINSQSDSPNKLSQNAWFYYTKSLQTVISRRRKMNPEFNCSKEQCYVMLPLALVDERCANNTIKQEKFSIPFIFIFKVK